MNDEKIFATKKDIEMLLQAIAGSNTSLEESLIKRIDERIDEGMQKFGERLETRLKAYFDGRFEELYVHTGAMIEEAERFLATGYEKISMHDDKLENHEGRIVRVEGVVGV